MMSAGRNENVHAGEAHRQFLAQQPHIVGGRPMVLFAELIWTSPSCVPIVPVAL